uniref:Uncharacterized protein n=1 Tax=Anguilla anguilla TaxID=7936 RepID=A0A0E9U5D5_ANGAN
MVRTKRNDGDQSWGLSGMVTDEDLDCGHRWKCTILGGRLLRVTIDEVLDPRC